ncbi:unnamed protein product, partial [Caretta caretta]
VDDGECLDCSLRSLDPGPSRKEFVPGQAQFKEAVGGSVVLEPGPTDGGWIRNQDTTGKGRQNLHEEGYPKLRINNNI